MTATVLITGGTGLLALNWALAIRDTHTVVLGLHERQVSLDRVQARQVDLESIEQITNMIEGAEIDMVVHTAGFASVEGCESQPELAQHVNVDLAANVAKACARLGLPLAHISTDHLFSGKEALLVESSPVMPINTYARTKAEAELKVLEAYPQALVVRTNFYGWGPSYRHSFSDVIISPLRSGKELTLFTDVHYTPVLAEVAVNAVHDLLKTKVSGIVNVVGDERISKYEFGIKIAREFELDAGLIKPGSLDDRPALARRPHDMSLSNEKACKLLGRKLGNVAEHLARLHQQETNGFAREIQRL